MKPDMPAGRDAMVDHLRRDHWLGEAELELPYEEWALDDLQSLHYYDHERHPESDMLSRDHSALEGLL